MRKDTFSSKIFTGFVSVFLVVISLTAGIYADNATMSASLKDDVTAMITNSKKLPHQIFIIDSSEMMNSFAYSDYVDTCKDSQSNLQKAIDLCDNAYQQCQNVEYNASCAVDLNCIDVYNKCSEARSMLNKLKTQCAKVYARYPDFEITKTADPDSQDAKKYVGPWDPSKFYDDDICFYHWTDDTNGDVINATSAYDKAMEEAKKKADAANAAEGTNDHTADEYITYSDLYHSAADAYNKKKLCQQWHETTEEACDSHFLQFLKDNGGFIAERSDWDCLTDGTNNFLPKSNGSTVNKTWQEIKNLYGGVSGHWLNRKYATSLDALKIILANRHEFSFPPRKRGKDSCYKTHYIPFLEYQEAALCTEADINVRPECSAVGDQLECSEADIENQVSEGSNCAGADSEHTPKFLNKKACFVAFDPTLSGEGVTDEMRKERLEALRTAISSMWKTNYMVEPDPSEADPGADPEADDNSVVTTKCTGFDILQNFSIYTKTSYTSVVEEAGDCGKCYKWQINSDNSGSFVETECRIYNGSVYGQNTEGLIGNFEETFSKQCCKAFNCTNPKCRDNDICCKDNISAYPDAQHGGDENIEGFKTCRPDYDCVLGFYSEYDQDANHCCTSVNCAEAGTPSSYYNSDLGKNCMKCDIGSPLGSDSAEASTGVVTILPQSVVNGQIQSYCGAGSTEENCLPISISVGIKSSDLASIDFDEIKSITFDVRYDCADSQADHPGLSLGTGTCSSAADCDSVVSGDLSGCSEAGYRMEVFVTVKREDCNFDNLNVNFDVVYSFGEAGYKLGTYDNKNVFDDTSAVYRTYNLQTSAADVERVYEYECKTSFYSRQAIVYNGSSCPSASSAPDYINNDPGHKGDKIDYCETRGFESEVLERDQWLNPIKMACSWLCAAAETYDEPWKCASFFYMMDDIDRNGPGQCDDRCKGAMTDNDKLARCCKCVNASQSQYRHHRPPTSVSMIDPDTHNEASYKCVVSGYQYGESPSILPGLIDGRRTEISGYQAEIVNGHITEGADKGYYNLSPYVWEGSNPKSPYPDENGWYTPYSLISSINGRRYLGSSLTSLFTTNGQTGRTNVCMNDILWGWSGNDCDDGCGIGCCTVDLSQNSNACDYPSFWMQIPHGNGGRLLMEAANLLVDDGAEERFRQTIKGIKAIGPSTLGETLYDSWRYLGGMRALHDPNYGQDKHYTSPYEATDVQCYTNEAIIISGGNPQFDDNVELKAYKSSACDDNFFSYFSSNGSGNYSSVPANKPCINSIYDDEGLSNLMVNQHTPYITQEWEKTSLMHVAKFVNRNTFWSPYEDCRTKPISENATGLSAACGGNTAASGANNNPSGSGEIDIKYPLIDRVHAIGIGEWGLSALYQSISGNGAYLDGSFIKQVASITKREGEQGRYYGLTATGDGTSSSSSASNEGGNFETLTSLFTAFVNKSRPSDVVVGRPHWTSSMVQPFDVEEKYRGPETYTAGAIPVDGSVSRFWFGNLKKYELTDSDSADDASCPIYDDTSSKCGEWKRQTFDALDCFGQSAGDAGDNFAVGDDGSDNSLEQFKKLMIGGAAAQLRKMIEDAGPGNFKTSPRNIYYDLEGSMLRLKDASGDELLYKFQPHRPTLTAPTLEQIFDYISGYDGFSEFGPRNNPRYLNKTSFTVDDPFDVDFSHPTEKKITLRPLYLGAIVHSKPVAIYYGNSGTTRIYAGANDGMLHAFDEKGKEVYAYMPGPAFKNITTFASSTAEIYFNATVDGPITMFHIDQSHDGIINGGEKAFLIFGYRRGAAGYTVIDVSDPTKPEFVQHINTDAGLSFGKAMIFRKCQGQCSYANDLEYYLAVPGGYDDCHDPTALTDAAEDNTPSCPQNSLLGNKFRIYKFDTTQNKFSSYIEYSSSSNSLGDFEKSWLTTSFTAVPFVINTKGKAAVDTEFVYFTDLSGTVFRVDVSSNSMADWTAKVVYAKRNGGSGTALKRVEWDDIGRTFVGMNIFPPLERYNPSRSSDGTSVADFKIPIPVIAGNSANPKFKKSEVMNTFYDDKTIEYNYSKLYDSDFYVNSDGEAHDPKNTMIENKRGWQIQFNPNNGEKGITEPLIVYDIYSSNSSSGGSANTANSYSIAWNTYIPMDANQCKSLGTSSNYERFIPDGAQVFKDLAMTGSNGEWNLSAGTGECVPQSSGMSLATSVGIVATDNGYDITFGAGAEIFRKEKLTVKRNATYIIKWYELY